MDFFDIPNSGMNDDEYEARAANDPFVQSNPFEVDDDVLVGMTHWTVIQVVGGTCKLQHQSRKHLVKWLHWSRLTLEYRKPIDSEY